MNSTDSEQMTSPGNHGCREEGHDIPPLIHVIAWMIGTGRIEQARDLARRHPLTKPSIS